MHRLDEIISILSASLDTRRKRHITGGVLLSAALLFGGLAFTVITLKPEINDGKRN